MFLPRTNLNHAAQVAERIRKAIAKYPWHTVINENIQLTTSIGVSELKPDDSVNTLVKRADDALYRGKEAGRNWSNSNRRLHVANQKQHHHRHRTDRQLLGTWYIFSKGLTDFRSMDRSVTVKGSLNASMFRRHRHLADSIYRCQQSAFGYLSNH